MRKKMVEKKTEKLKLSNYQGKYLLIFEILKHVELSTLLLIKQLTHIQRFQMLTVKKNATIKK